MPYVQTAEGKLFYTRREGPQDGPVLVLIHGAGGSRLHWPPQLRRIPKATVYTVDLPGHGRSEGLGCRTIEGYVAAVTDLLEENTVDFAGASAPVIVGHSMGGAVAQKMALDERERVSALVLLSTGARLRVAPAILEGIERDFEQAVNLITEYAWSSGAPPSLIGLGRRALRETGSEVLLRDFLACDRFDVMGRVEDIDVPALIVAGSADRLTPIKYSRFLSERIPDGRLVTVAGAGHMVMLERPEVVAEAIQAFVTTDH